MERERGGERKSKERNKGKGAKKKAREANSREEKQNSEGCSVREGERVDKIT